MDKHIERNTIEQVYVPKIVNELFDYVIDIYDELHGKEDVKDPLFEGAQGFELDIDWGDYPYVTSSSCTVSGALTERSTISVKR